MSQQENGWDEAQIMKLAIMDLMLTAYQVLFGS